jgi:hypothetical protein
MHLAILSSFTILHSCRALHNRVLGYEEEMNRRRLKMDFTLTKSGGGRWEEEKTRVETLAIYVIYKRLLG